MVYSSADFASPRTRGPFAPAQTEFPLPAARPSVAVSARSSPLRRWCAGKCRKGSYPASDRSDRIVDRDAEPRSAGADRVGDVAGREMSIVQLHHAGIAVAQVPRHHHERRAVHDCKACPGMAQDMNADRRDNARALASVTHAQILVALPPRRAVILAEQQLASGTTGRQTREERDPFLSQDNVARFAGL